MIRKLVSFDIKLHLKEVLIASLAVIILGMIPSLLVGINASSSLIAISYTPWTFSLIGLGIYTFVIIYKMLYKALFENEAYFTFSIPTKMINILIAKIIVSFIILSVIAIAIISSVLMHIFVIASLDGPSLGQIVQDIVRVFGILDANEWLALIVLIGFLIVTTLLAIVSFILASIMVSVLGIRRFKIPILFIFWQIINGILSLLSLSLSSLNNNNTLLMMSLSILLNALLVIGTTLLCALAMERKIDIE